jgi:hypothetical protein
MVRVYAAVAYETIIMAEAHRVNKRAKSFSFPQSKASALPKNAKHCVDKL